MVKPYPCSAGVYVDGATSCFVTCEEEVFEALALGDAARAVASTNMNATSSRCCNVTNQPQVLHTSTGKCTDKTCLISGPTRSS